MNFTELNAVISNVNVVNPVTKPKSANPWDTLKRPSMLAFQVILEWKEGEKNPEEMQLRRYPGEPAIFDSKAHMLPYATRPALDMIVPPGYMYGVLTATANGSEERKLMKEKIEIWLKYGYKMDGIHYRPIYSMVDGSEATVFFITAGATVLDRATGGHRLVRTINDLGLCLSSDRKAPKRARREFANYTLALEGVEYGSYVNEDGTIYDCRLEDGRYITICVCDMSGWTEAEEKAVDGSVVINLPEFDGCIATISGSFGQAKGIGYNVPNCDKYTVYVFGAKKELIREDGWIFLGALSHIHEGELFTDLQTITNAGAYDDNLLVEMALKAMNDRSELLMDGTDDQILDLFAAAARAENTRHAKNYKSKPKWTTMQALEFGVGRLFTPKVFRSVFRHGFKGAIDLDRMRVPVAEGGRFYARWDPSMGTSSGRPDVDLSVIPDEHNGLPVVCIPGAPEGEVLLARNPNTHPGEFVLCYNFHIEYLKEYKHKGWVFFGRRAGELLGHMNGGDMDDAIMVIWMEAFIAKWRTMQYPVQPKIVQPKPASMGGARSSRISRMTGIADRWNWNTFIDRDLEEYTGFSKSLGAFINKGTFEMLHSGEHREAIAECLENGTYMVPEEFNIPAKATLKDMLSADLKKFVGADYTPTIENFVAVCKAINAGKEDYRGARAMSNSDAIIDSTVMKKGDQGIVDMLFAEADELVKMPYFPMCFADRVPAKRKAAQDYILVETKLCRAIQQIETRHEEILKEAKEMEQLLVRELPEVLLEAYPADEMIVETCDMLNTWRVRAIRNEVARCKDLGIEFDGEAFNRIAEGYTENETIYQSVPKIDAHGNPYEHKIPAGTKSTRQPGFIDFYTHQFEPVGNGELKLVRSENAQGKMVYRKWTTETRLKLAIHLLNMQYADGKTTDGVPDFVMVDLLMALKSIGLTGRVAFVDINSEARKYGKKGSMYVVVDGDGQVYHARNNVRLSNTPCPYLIDTTPTLAGRQSYLMSPEGVIIVTESAPELQSDYKEIVKAEQAEGIFVGGQDSDSDQEFDPFQG